MTKYVYDFTEGDKDQKALLGGKGANLAEMTKLGLPVPPGFTITTEACREYLAHGSAPGELRVQVTMALRQLEDNLGRRLGDRHDPLLVSVRSGAAFSMPGMMETVLNIGLNDASVKGLAEESGDERFAWDSYRRLLQMFGKTVLEIPGEVFSDLLDKVKSAKGVTNDVDLGVGDLQGLVTGFRTRCANIPARSSRSTRASSWTWRSTPSSTPGTPTGPGCTAAASASRSTSAPRSTSARWFRQPRRHQRHRGGVHPRPGVRAHRRLRRLPRQRQGEDVVAGIRNTLSLDDLKALDPPRTSS